MDPNDRNPHGGEDAGAAREHVRAAAANRDALAGQAGPDDAGAPQATSPPTGTGGPMNTSGADRAPRPADASRGDGMGERTANTDTGAAREHVRAAEENRDALAAESARVERSVPDGNDTTRRP